MKSDSIEHSRIFSALACGLCVTLVLEGAGAAQRPAVERLVEEARAAHQADHQAWKAYAFDRHVTRRSVDKDGKVTFQEELHFHVTPAGDSCDEELYEIDGRSPSAKEVAEHRAAGRFLKHREQAATFELENPIGEDLALGPMILDQPYELVGEEEIEGIRCYRLAFDARPEPAGLDAKERLKYALKGGACLSVDGAHIVEMEFESTRPIKKFPAELEHMWLRFEKRPVAGVWLPRLIAVRSAAKIPGNNLRKWNEYRYTDYKR